MIDVSDWRAHSLYKGGYNCNHIVINRLLILVTVYIQVIHHFWQFVLSLSNEMRAKIVRFVTGWNFITALSVKKEDQVLPVFQ